MAWMPRRGDIDQTVNSANSIALNLEAKCVDTAATAASQNVELISES